MRKRRILAFVAIASAVAGAAGACGSRTGLPVDDVPESDATPDARRDGGRDTRADVPNESSMLDVPLRPDVDRSDCPDADATLVYLINTDYQLYSFYPPTGTFRLIGRITCQQPPGSTATPFSMAVDRKGVALVVFNDGRLYRVLTSTAACEATKFVPNQQGFATFGMGYSSDTSGPSETLFIAGDGSGTGAARGLASIDSSYLLHPIAQFTPAIDRAEFTGTGAGGLYAFYQDQGTAYVGQVDKRTARVDPRVPLPGVDQGQGWAFAFWGGDFWLFTAPSGTTQVTRFRPSDNSITVTARHSSVIVGAGVSTCAPQ